ncbi:hypothetical protein CAC42_2047 [Sphaceloma murrayae]|uniref:tRNA(Phe) 7-[(3-amino-3-carboxypropyl)-4-demethylwyosine(37)-N(4)]-methyltransferase n=1 Tax=Sphaceloma murrayae TaxID=2082308 RepID=A0A2K1QI25_9PEZI|nr:hypothetical protein CAC42_2047 [Sphaceloma murrayae]
MSSVFQSKKAKILSQLSVPDDDYDDASPKGSVDAPIQSLISDINAIDSLVTTSSCSGRIAIFAHGLKSNPVPDIDLSHENTDTNTITPTKAAPSQTSTAQGKGTGAWLFVSHEPLPHPFPPPQSTTSPPSPDPLLHTLLTLPGNEISTPPPRSISSHPSDPIPPSSRLLHLKFEPLILHILCASLPSARKVLVAAQGAGFRESGISSVPNVEDEAEPGSRQKHDATRRHGEDGGGTIGSAPVGDAGDGGLEVGFKGRTFPRRPKKSQKQSSGPVMVAIRTTGLAMDAPIGYMTAEGAVRLSVSDAYLGSILAVANERFGGNEERKVRLREGILRAFQ